MGCGASASRSSRVQPAALASDAQRAEQGKILFEIRRAQGLIDTDTFTHSDPYCVASLVSDAGALGDARRTPTIASGGRNPAWADGAGALELSWAGEEWLYVQVMDEDHVVPDDHVGFCILRVSVLCRSPGERDLQLYINGTDPAGTLSVSVSFAGVIPAEDTARQLLQTALCKRHDNTEHLTTYELTLERVADVFGTHKNCNFDEKHAQIFEATTKGSLIRAAISVQHGLLYRDGALASFSARSSVLTNIAAPSQAAPDRPPAVLGKSERNELFRLSSGEDFLSLIRHGVRGGVRRVYTYVIQDTADDRGFMRFSETSANKLKDLMSKHAMHARASADVRMAGTFRVVESPDMGESKYIVVFDNDSGTYRPDGKDLRFVKELLEYNFSGLRAEGLDICEAQPEYLKSYVGPNEAKGDPDSVYPGQWAWGASKTVA